MHFTHSVYQKILTPTFSSFRIKVVTCANLVVRVWKSLCLGNAYSLWLPAFKPDYVQITQTSQSAMWSIIICHQRQAERRGNEPLGLGRTQRVFTHQLFKHRPVGNIVEPRAQVLFHKHQILEISERHKALMQENVLHFSKFTSKAASFAQFPCMTPDSTSLHWYEQCDIPVGCNGDGYRSFAGLQRKWSHLLGWRLSCCWAVCSRDPALGLCQTDSLIHCFLIKAYGML